jgi:hypothetical protein
LSRGRRTFTEKQKLYAKKSQCEFRFKLIEYLGYVISEQGVATDPNKIALMKNWKTPRTISELRGFLGLTRYYRKFISNYGLISKPLTSLLKKDGFKGS